MYTCTVIVWYINIGDVLIFLISNIFVVLNGCMCIQVVDGLCRRVCVLCLKALQ